MKTKNLYLFLALGIFTFSVNADNPGEDVVAEEAVQQEEAVVEEATATVADDASSDGAQSVGENEDGAVVLEKVVVTGSKIKKAQIEGPLPLLVITKEDIDNSGFRNVTEALQSIPSANQYTQNESLNNNFTPNANELDLRNLGPGRVLYLINGRRTADYPLPYNNAGNISNIGVVPAGLVDRIEILSQGASAIYGSDAVTGVVNVITVKGKDFQELDVDVLETQYEGKNQYSISYTAGGFFGNSSWTVGLDYSHVDPMTYADRPGHDSFVNDPDYGVAYTAPRYGLYWYTLGSYGGKRGWYGSEEFPSTPSCAELSGGEYFDFDKQDDEWLYSGSLPGRGCGWDYGSDRFGGSSQTIVNERDDVTALLSFTHNFDNGVEMNTRAYRYYDEAFYRGYPRFYQDFEFLDPGRIGALQAESTDPFNNLSDGSAGSLVSQYFLRFFAPSQGENFDARRDITEEVTDFFIGFNGFFDNGWEWDIGLNTTSYTYENENMTFTTDLYDYMRGIGATNSDGSPVLSSYTGAPCATGVFGRFNSCFLPERLFGVMSNELMGSFLADDSLLGESNQTTLDFLVTGEFEALNRFIGFAATVEIQEQDYKLTPSDNRLGLTDVEFIQGSAVAGGGDRDRKSFGIEFSLPVSDKLEMTIASRFDEYDDASSNVGSRLSNMVNFAYRPNSSLLIRGSASETFRAPDMNYLFQNESSGFYNSLTDYTKCYAFYLSGDAQYANYDTYRDCEISTPSVRGFFSGNTELEEEEGENFQLGLVWSVNDNTTFTIDLYQVLLDQSVSRESPSGLNLAEGKCRFGDDFVRFMESDNIPDRDCDLVLSKITRDPITVDPISGVPTLFGDWLTVRPDYVNQSSMEYQGIDWNWNKRVETENAGDFYINVLSSHIIAVYSKFDALSDEIEYLSYYTYEPRSQQNMSVSWVYQDFSTTLFVDRLGHMEWGSRGKSDPHITSNITTRYNYSPDLNVFFSIRNLDDKMPQKDPGYGYPYYNQNYFSAFGRYYSAGFNYRF
ncbi:TonB-dependent receptor [Gammaproteobacteria bacterium]|nr:TonB-dependent receptor [Gammaproteobacteria bacterium]